MKKTLKSQKLEASATFSEYVRNVKSLDYNELDRKGLNPEFLREQIPAGIMDGSEFCIGDADGGMGRSFKFNLETGQFNQFNPAESGGAGKGLAAYFSKLWRCNLAEAAQRLAELLNVEGVSDDGTLILPIPEGTEELRLPPHLQKDLTNIYDYKDLDGGLLGKRLRWQRQNGEKIIITYTYRSGEGWTPRGWEKNNPLYGMEYLTSERREDPIVIVEGEKACDKARLLGGEHDRFIWLTWANGSKAIETLWLAPLKGRTVYLWPDNDGAGRIAMSRLAMRLQTLQGVTVKIVKSIQHKGLPSGWDIADWDKNSGIDIVKELEGAETSDNLENILNEWVYWPEQKRFVEVSSGIFYDKDGFNNKFANNFGVNKLSKLFLEHADRIDLQGVKYRPNIDKDVFEEGGKRYLNLWKDKSVEAIEGDVKIFTDHMEKLIPSETERQHTLDWMAWNIQRAGEKIKHALIIQGEQGIGKSFLAEMFQLMLGDNVGFAETISLGSDYTGFLNQKHLTIIHELYSTERREVAEKLKSWITESEIKIHEKYQPTLSLENVINFMMFTNHTDAITIEPSDRRYFVVFSPMRPQGNDYYDSLFTWMKNNLGPLKYYFLKRDLSKFSPDKAPPITEGKLAMMQESKSNVRFELDYMMEEEVAPFHKDLFIMSDLETALADKGRKQNVKVLSKTLADMNIPAICKIRLNGNQPRVYAWRNIDSWKKENMETIKKEFREVM